MDKPPSSIPEQVQQFAPKLKQRKDGPTEDLRGLLQRAAGIISNEKYKCHNALHTKVADHPSSAIPDQGFKFTPKQLAEDDSIDKSVHDPVDKAGHALITLLNKAASISNEEYERATNLAGDLANQLRTTESRIKELEAEASYFRDRAARAEEWLQRISREIESKFIAQGASRPVSPNSLVADSNSGPA